MALLLETSDLGIHFGGVWGLHDFNLTVEEGEVHGFIGPNGSGKSTLFGLINGRHRPSVGSVHFKGRDLKGLSIDERARLGITMKFQITNVFSGLSTMENMRLGLLGPRSIWGSFRSSRARQDEERAEELLNTVGLWERRDMLAGELAHGEKGWLEIGMALATDPQLLMLDEPASGMGREETEKTAELIKRVRVGRTILVIEHDMEFVQEVADRITVLLRGGLLTQGSYDEVKSDERVIDAYLGRGREHGLSEH
jgi:urea ABC transporter ATP-binding protein UrtD